MEQNKIIGIISATAIYLMVATVLGPSNAHFVYADANCDKAGDTTNPAGNFKGNVKQCDLPDFLGPKEPIRSCNSDPDQRFKDNDGDGVSGCRIRGSS